VAVARALVVRPSLLLLDEPFSALDRKLRETMQVELKQLLREVGITAIFVTHDQEEALVVSDRVAVMNAGQIEQLTDPVTLYNAPTSLYVLDFVGQSTKLSGKVLGSSNGMVEVQTAFGVLRAPASFMAGSSVAVAVRPEAMLLAPQAEATLNTLQGRISDISFLGSRTQIHLDAPAEGEDRVILELSRLPAGVTTGQEVSFGFRVADTMAFPA
jgi:putative spermidine/putrescine transport system ATP-binding protein